ncbi:MAG: efflux RND transporter permease subunit, partial [bacterium]
MERALAELPAEIRNDFLGTFAPGAEPVIWAGISLPDGTENAHALVNDTIARRLERVSGVGEVDVWGADPKRDFINFHLDRLLAHGVDLGAVVATLGGDNFQLASGRIVERGQVRYVRSLARWESVDALAATPIKAGVTLGDIATLEYRLDPSADINHIDGRDGAALGIRKESGANTVAVTRAVREAFAELEADPRAGGARFVTFFDQG